MGVTDVVVGIPARREEPSAVSQERGSTDCATQKVRPERMAIQMSLDKNDNPENLDRQKLTVDALCVVAKSLDRQRDISALYQTSRIMASGLASLQYERDILAVEAKDKESGTYVYNNEVYEMAKCNYESHNSALARKHREFPRHFGEKPPALHWACVIGSVSMAKKIIKSALKLYSHYLNSKDMYGCTPLFLAVEHGRVEIVRALIEAGCYVDAPVPTAVYINTYLNSGRFEILTFNYVIVRPYWKEDTGNLDEATPLAFAITHRKLAIAELLAKHTRRPYITCGEQGLVSALDLASLSGLTEVAEDVNEKSPLRWAIHSCNISNALYLIQLEKGDYVGKRFTTALLASIKKDCNIPITWALVERFISQDRIHDIESTLSTSLQCGERTPLTTQYLLQMLAVRIPKRHWKRSRTYLHWALNREVVAGEVIRTFIDQCLWLVDINAKDSDGKTALYYAKKFKHKKIAKLLRKHGAKDT
ncbi:ankyrin repeat-containing domain protein [Biscogniauxia marginata]|nr:ankyrin repeat-containing domain protein [Biscogniauxia marginata]